ncbi:hypothetical protein [Bacillus sp. C1]
MTFLQTFFIDLQKSDINLQKYGYDVYINPFWIFQHITRCYKGQKVNYTHSLSLFSLGMGQEEGLTASTHGRMLSPS